MISHALRAFLLIAALSLPVQASSAGEVKVLTAGAFKQVLLVTHDPEEAATLADRVLVMRNRRAVGELPGGAKPRGLAVGAVLATGVCVSDDSRTGALVLLASSSDVAAAPSLPSANSASNAAAKASGVIRTVTLTSARSEAVEMITRSFIGDPRSSLQPLAALPRPSSDAPESSGGNGR